MEICVFLYAILLVLVRIYPNKDPLYTLFIQNHLRKTSIFYNG